MHYIPGTWLRSLLLSEHNATIKARIIKVQLYIYDKWMCRVEYYRFLYVMFVPHRKYLKPWKIRLCCSLPEVVLWTIRTSYIKSNSILIWFQLHFAKIWQIYTWTFFFKSTQALLSRRYYSLLYIVEYLLKSECDLPQLSKHKSHRKWPAFWRIFWQNS